jgi:hypothetical protein
MKLDAASQGVDTFNTCLVQVGASCFGSFLYFFLESHSKQASKHSCSMTMDLQTTRMVTR